MFTWPREKAAASLAEMEREISSSPEHMLPIKVWGWGDGVVGGVGMELLDRREKAPVSACLASSQGVLPFGWSGGYLVGANHSSAERGGGSNDLDVPRHKILFLVE